MQKGVYQTRGVVIERLIGASVLGDSIDSTRFRTFNAGSVRTTGLTSEPLFNMLCVVVLQDALFGLGASYHEQCDDALHRLEL